MGEFRCQVKTDSAAGSELKLLQQPKVALSHWRVRDTRLHEHFIFFSSADFSNFGVAADAAAAWEPQPVAVSGRRFVFSPSASAAEVGKKEGKKKKKHPQVQQLLSLCVQLGLLKRPPEESERDEKNEKASSPPIKKTSR